MPKIIKIIFLVIILMASAVSTVFGHWPVVNKSSRISTWYSRHHPAIDIASYCGTKIVPIDTGTVVFAGWKNNHGGWQVWIRHNGYYTAYYHMRYRPKVRAGQRVYIQKTIIGYVGATGHATGCHVHVEVWKGYPWAKNSYRVNPWKYINHGVYVPTRYKASTTAAKVVVPKSTPIPEPVIIIPRINRWAFMPI